MLDAVLKIAHFPIAEAMTAIAIMDAIDMPGLADQPILLAIGNHIAILSPMNALDQLPDLAVDLAGCSTIVAIIMGGNRGGGGDCACDQHCSGDEFTHGPTPHFERTPV